MMSLDKLSKPEIPEFHLQNICMDTIKEIHLHWSSKHDSTESASLQRLLSVH